MSGNAGAVYFNEFDRYPAAWLRNLYPAATVDERSIADVGSEDLAGYARAHFFGGIGGWEYALDLAGWPAGREVWTGSCPCQPFSAAGRGLGAADPRHLWPEFYRLIAERRPSVVFGEQVGGAAGRGWLAAVRADLEAIGYAVGAADLCAAGVGAPHIRQRLYWVADRIGDGLEGVDVDRPASGAAIGSGADGRLADSERGEFRGGGPGPAGGPASGVQGTDGQRQLVRPDARAGGAVVDGGMADAMHAERRALDLDRQDGRDGQDDRRAQAHGEPGARGEVRADVWADLEWLACTDGKWRPTGAGIRPLAHGVPARASKLRAYGNAIVPQLAAEFIRAFMDCEVAA